MSGELIAEGTGGGYGLPGQGFEVVEVRVRDVGGWCRARAGSGLLGLRGHPGGYLAEGCFRSDPLGRILICGPAV
mgnify:CR=1 FL=1